MEFIFRDCSSEERRLAPFGSQDLYAGDAPEIVGSNPISLANIKQR